MSDLNDLRNANLLAKKYGIKDSNGKMLLDEKCRDACLEMADWKDSQFDKLCESGEASDGFHTFNELYEQREVLFAALVNTYKDLAWKSHRHENGELCFGGEWFIVGIDTPEGSYTYHYKNECWNDFDCVELECGKHWDGHTAKDVRRLLSLIKK